MSVTVQRTTIANGDAGVLQTLAVMAQLIDRAQDDPMAVQFARQLVSLFNSGHNQYLTATQLRYWLARVWVYVDDPAARELLRDANGMLREYDATARVTGDCDEAAILGASLGVAVGIPATLTVLAFDTGAASGAARYSHVYASLLPDNGPEVMLDVTRPPAGTPIPPVTRWLTVAV